MQGFVLLHPRYVSPTDGIIFIKVNSNNSCYGKEYWTAVWPVGVTIRIDQGEMKIYCSILINQIVFF